MIVVGFLGLFIYFILVRCIKEFFILEYLGFILFHQIVWIFSFCKSFFNMRTRHLSYKSTFVLFILSYRWERQCDLSSSGSDIQRILSLSVYLMTWACALRGKQDKLKHWESAVLSIIFGVLWLTVSCRTSDLSRYLKGDSAMDHRERMKQAMGKQKRKYSPLDKALLL